jgi:hypothetical protein
MSNHLSNHLHWRPVTAGTRLHDDLKPYLAKRLWDSDGLTERHDIVVDTELLPYLEGLRDAGIIGAGDLIAAIKRHQNVYLAIY